MVYRPAVHYDDTTWGTTIYYVYILYKIYMHKRLVNTSTIVPEGWPRVGGASASIMFEFFSFDRFTRKHRGRTERRYTSLLRKTGRCYIKK